MCYVEDTGLESLNIYTNNVKLYDQLFPSLEEKWDRIQFTFETASL